MNGETIARTFSTNIWSSGWNPRFNACWNPNENITNLEYPMMLTDFRVSLARLESEKSKSYKGNSPARNFKAGSARPT